MKKVSFYRNFMFASLVLLGCKADMIDYKGKAGVYFAVQHPWISGGGDSTTWEYAPKTEVPFIVTTSSDSLVRLKVKLLGNLVNKDRTFKMVVVDSGTTAIKGEDFEWPKNEFVMEANSSITDVFVQVYKTPSLKDTMRKIMFELVPTPDFQLPINTWYPAPGQYGYSPKPGAPVEDISAIRHTIVLSDVITNQPTGWYAGFFGDFSKKKFDVLSEWFNLTWNDFLRENMDPNRARAFAQKAKYKLQELEEQGTPVMEADGVTPMTMGFLI